MGLRVVLLAGLRCGSNRQAQLDWCLGREVLR